MENLNLYFEQELSHLTFDAALAKQFRLYRLQFENKNEDHMTFLGGNLTGVQVVRFTQSDRNYWFSDILLVNEYELEQKIHSLSSINTSWAVSSDIYNLCSIWLMHKFLNSYKINEEQKKDVLLDIAMMLNYKFLTGLHSHYFRWPLDPQIAAATYAQLSAKYTIKQQGSWRQTIIVRCDDLVSKDGLHYSVVKNFKKDSDVVNALNDTQSRIRSMLKNIMAETLKVKAQGSKIQKTSKITLDVEGQEILRDKVKSLLNYTRYVHSIASDKNSFIKEELIDVIEKIMPTMPRKLLTETLGWFVDNYYYDRAKMAQKLIDGILSHAFGLLTSNTDIVTRTQDLADFMARIRGVYMSSRSQDVELLQLRSKAEELVKAAKVSKNPSVVSSVKTGLMLYVCLRAFTKNHYS